MRSERPTDICHEIGNLIEGYAVGALDADEMLHVAARISECPHEQQKLQQYEETVGLLGLTAPLVQPPEALWDRLRNSTAAGLVHEPIEIGSRRQGGITVPRWAAVLVSAAALLLFVTSISLGVALRRSDDGRSEEHTSELQSRLHLVCRL